MFFLKKIIFCSCYCNGVILRPMTPVNKNVIEA